MGGSTWESFAECKEDLWGGAVHSGCDLGNVDWDTLERSIAEVIRESSIFTPGSNRTPENSSFTVGDTFPSRNGSFAEQSKMLLLASETSPSSSSATNSSATSNSSWVCNFSDCGKVFGRRCDLK